MQLFIAANTIAPAIPPIALLPYTFPIFIQFVIEALAPPPTSSEPIIPPAFSPEYIGPKLTQLEINIEE